MYDTCIGYRTYYLSLYLSLSLSLSLYIYIYIYIYIEGPSRCRRKPRGGRRVGGAANMCVYIHMCVYI